MVSGCFHIKSISTKIKYSGKLKISKLYDITINDIIEPEILPQRVADFEQISAIPKKELKETLKQFDTNSVAIALMRASPEINSFFEKMLPDIDFELIRNQIGMVRIENVEKMQNQIICILNLKRMGFVRINQSFLNFTTAGKHFTVNGLF